MSETTDSVQAAVRVGVEELRVQLSEIVSSTAINSSMQQPSDTAQTQVSGYLSQFPAKHCSLCSVLRTL